MEYIIIAEKELKHHGVKGMKWGVRKQQRNNFYRQNVKAYRSKYDSWERKQNTADKKWKETRSTYNSLAKTRIGRMREVAKAQKGKGSAVANKYLKQWDSWEKSQDSADAAWRDTKSARNKTGKTAVTRLFNNVKYRNG